MYERVLAHPRVPSSGVLLRRRLGRIGVISVGLAGLVVATIHESPLSFLVLLVAALFGGIVGVGTREWDTYAVMGDLIFGTVGGVALAWVVVGLLPTLYFRVNFLGAVLATVYRVGAGSWVVLFSFYAGVFAGGFFAAFRPPLSARRGAAVLVVGLLAYVAGRVLVLSVTSGFGSSTGVAVTSGGGGARYASQLVQMAGGLSAFVGTVAMVRELPARKALLATLAVTALLGGAGIVSADATFSAVLTASEVREGVTTTVADPRVEGRTFRLTVTVENPTDEALLLRGGFVRLFAGGDQLAWGPVRVAGAPIEVGAGEAVTAEYVLRLSPEQAEATSAALESEGAVRVVGRHSVGTGDAGFSVRFRASLD